MSMVHALILDGSFHGYVMQCVCLPLILYASFSVGISLFPIQVSSLFRPYHTLCSHKMTFGKESNKMTSDLAGKSALQIPIGGINSQLIGGNEWAGGKIDGRGWFAIIRA